MLLSMKAYAKQPLNLFSLLILFLLLGSTSCSKEDNQPSNPPSSITTPAALTAALTEIYQDSDAPGFAVSVVKNDGIIYQQTFGQANIEANIAYSNQTVQAIGSISKTFVAAAIVKAIEQGHFTLETDINDILPIELVNPKQADHPILVKHLVTHTSGLLDNIEIYLAGYHILPGEDLSGTGAQLLQEALGASQRPTADLDEFLAEYYLEDGDLYASNNFGAIDPGTVWNYSNIATSLAAYLVETATGVDFRTYVAAHILEPLGMSHSGYDISEFDPQQVATLYWDKNTPLPAYSHESYPDGSLMTSNEDLSKYLLDMMKGVKGQSSTLFSPAGYDLLFTGLLPNGVVPASIAKNQGVFWFLDNNTVQHSGADPGTTCLLEFDRSGESGYFLLTNMDESTEEHSVAWRQFSTKIEQAINAFIEAN
ncbi:MAG: beta-lactamase family protein [Saprospiraceae bacterium]|nr:beta-lactamase family protein [Saprospiraceae bacterium]